MKSSLLVKVILAASLITALLAPFTFQKIKPLPVVAEVKNKDIIKSVVKIIEKPLHAVNIPKFSAIRDIKEKKRQFFNFIRPSIEKANRQLLGTRKNLQAWLEKVSLEESLTEVEQAKLVSLVKSYKVNKQYSLLQQLDELLIRVDVVPTPLVLVQAANESAWGTSRFARIGLNFFGIWCYRQGCGMVPSGRNHGAKHEVAAFKSVDQAVKRYLFNINTNNAYIVFRTIRGQLRAQNQPLQPEVLATGLLPYSERGTDYVLEITEMIRHNQAYFVDDELQAE